MKRRLILIMTLLILVLALGVSLTVAWEPYQVPVEYGEPVAPAFFLTAQYSEN